MRWEIDDNCRVDLVFYSGLSCSGDETAVRIFPSGRKGDIEHPFQSMKVFATEGIRVYICARSRDDWETGPWRCFRVVGGIGVATPSRRRMLRIHDLDLLCPPDALRQPPGSEESFPVVASPADGEGWTFGSQPGKLKGRIRQIRIVKE